MTKITIKEIASKAGVSHSTVSRALNHDPRIRESTKNRIKQIAQSMGYVPNLVARSFVQGKTATIGVIISYLGNDFLSEMMQGIERVVEEAGFVCLVGNSNEDTDRESLYIQTFAERRVDGLILYPSHEDDLESHIRLLEAYGLPFVLVDKYCESRQSDFVVCDDLYGGQLATSHLLRAGHFRIGHISAPPCTSLNNRFAGYRQALEEKGLPFDSELSVIGSFDSLHGYYDAYQQTHDLMTSGNPPTALFVATDGLVPSIFRALRDLALKVPSDVSVVGFGDIRSIAFMDVPLTTIAYPTLAVGEMAAGLLLEKIHGKRSFTDCKGISLTPRLIVRESTSGLRT